MKHLEYFLIMPTYFILFTMLIIFTDFSIMIKLTVILSIIILFLYILNLSSDRINQIIYFNKGLFLTGILLPVTMLVLNLTPLVLDFTAVKIYENLIFAIILILISKIIQYYLIIKLKNERDKKNSIYLTISILMFHLYFLIYLTNYFENILVIHFLSHPVGIILYIILVIYSLIVIVFSQAIYAIIDKHFKLFISLFVVYLSLLITSYISQFLYLFYSIFPIFLLLLLILLFFLIIFLSLFIRLLLIKAEKYFSSERIILLITITIFLLIGIFSFISYNQIESINNTHYEKIEIEVEQMQDKHEKEFENLSIIDSSTEVPFSFPKSIKINCYEYKGITWKDGEVHSVQKARHTCI